MVKVIKLNNDMHLYGTIIEKGTVPNRGSYIKFSDGTMIACYYLTLDNVNTTYHYIRGDWTFPIPFIEKPNVQCTIENWGTNIMTSKVNSNYATCNIMEQELKWSDGNPVNPTAPKYAHLYAIGRWK